MIRTVVVIIVLLTNTFELNYAQASSSAYDAALAESLDADDYGMKNYVLVVLTTGNNDISDTEQKSRLFRGHFANMARLAKEKKLVLAGPLMEADPRRGLFIYNVATIEEAELLVNTDPAVKAGIFNYELTKLYSSAALLMVNGIHQTIQKIAIE
tara:strand:- start:3006 stop:3470 length:465 start_codon:yes stop_codon:yes gene_type:complete